MKRVIVLGGGESGVGAALLAHKKNNKVFLSEYGSIKEINKAELDQYNIRFEEGGHTLEIIKEADVVIKSPGIPEEAAIIKSIRQEGIEIISEIEYAFQHCTAKIIGITGSNGKTTTTLMIYDLLVKSGFDVGLCGNVGFSFARLLSEQVQKAWYVIELSSFQLDDIKTFRPDIAILLNITADHLDRYQGDITLYAKAKFKIAQNQNKNDLLIYNGEDDIIKNKLSSIDKGQRLLKIEISKQKNISLLTSKEATIDIADFPLKGEHNKLNALFAVEAALDIGLTLDEVQENLVTFNNASHRMESVASIDNVLYINDSKATNVDAVFYALDAFKKSIVWIVGGKDKGNDYERLLPLVLQKVKAIICLGVDNSKLIEYFTPYIKIVEETQDINEAVGIARQYAESGDIVLLSPACASFDLFDHYEQRGDLFKEAVFNLLN